MERREGEEEIGSQLVLFSMAYTEKMRNKEAQSKYGLLFLWQTEGIMMKPSWSIKFRQACNGVVPIN
ncbi:hypothetical protein H839_06509 [Parageobacillus genomosp. 1]|uniref:Uncharacterized protein n=1 Tax=Parageobacillus genomosp. 1 TaxID=1295642 RepID=A0ABC9VF78_9BACL|nr:hypothetical protein H839_06509 [Parageobacillus genomosp. 1]